MARYHDGDAGGFVKNPKRDSVRKTEDDSRSKASKRKSLRLRADRIGKEQQ